jgi:peptide/nickel transport system substrate-binding protein
VRIKIGRWIAVIMLAVAFAWTGWGLSDVGAAGSSLQRPTIRLAGGDWGVPNPFKHAPQGPGFSKMQLLYDSLLEKNETGLIPWLARRWNVSEDQKSYTFTLAQNVKWHDGKALTAEDVKFTFKYYQNHPPVANDLIVNGRYFIQKVTAPDPHTVKITVDAPSAAYLGKIGYTRILPKHIWEKVSDPVKFAGKKATVGCGPYVLEEYQPQHGVYRMRAFRDYWGLKPKAAAIEWVPAGDSVLAFEKGDIDLIAVTPDLLPRYRKDSRYKIFTNKPYHGYRLILNMEKRPELKKVNVRKALIYGINRKEMVKKIARGSAVVTSAGYLPPGHPWYNSQVTQYAYNPAKAKRLLAGRALTLKLTVGNSMPEVKTAELLKLSLAKIGVAITIKSVDRKTRDAVMRAGNYELLIVNSGGLGEDPDYLREVYGGSAVRAGGKESSSSALPGYKNEKIAQLSRKQVKEMNAAKRKKMIFTLQELIAKDVPQIPLFNTIDNYVYRPSRYQGWMCRYDHNKPDHCKLSYLERSDQK